MVERIEHRGRGTLPHPRGAALVDGRTQGSSAVRDAVYTVRQAIWLVSETLRPNRRPTRVRWVSVAAMRSTGMPQASSCSLSTT